MTTTETPVCEVPGSHEEHHVRHWGLDAPSWIAIAALCACYFLLGNEWDRPIREPEGFNLDAADIESQAEQGRNLWRLAFIGIGAVGTCLCLSRQRLPIRIHGLLGGLSVATMSWCLLSVLWSEEPTVTVRRFIALLCAFTGAVGFAGRFPASHVCVLALTYSWIVLIASIGVEIYHGTFSFFSQEYRFAGTFHPNQQAINLSVMAMSAYVIGCSVRRRRRIWLWGMMAIAAYFLLLTRSRGALAACLVGFVALWWLHTSRKSKWISALVVSLTICAAVTSLLLLGRDDPEAVTRIALLGRVDEGHESLTGRIPLWQFSLEDLWERPILGYGYNSYWNDERLADAHQVLEWALPDVHNAYLETALSIGLVGLALVVMTVMAGMRALSRASRHGHDPGYSFAFALAAFGLVNAVFESHMLVPFNFSPFLVGCVLVQLAFFDKSPERSIQVMRQGAVP
jgi:O-antigen ligase